MTCKCLFRLVAVALTMMIWTSAIIPPVLATSPVNSVDSGLQRIQHISIIESGVASAPLDSIINTTSDTVTVLICDPLSTGITTTEYIPESIDSLIFSGEAVPNQLPASPVDGAIMNLTSRGYSLTKHTEHTYTVTQTYKDGAPSSTLDVYASYYVFTHPDFKLEQLVTVIKPLKINGTPMVVVSPLDDTTTVEHTLDASTIQTSEAGETTPLLVTTGGAAVAAGVIGAKVLGLSLGLCFVVMVAVTVVLYTVCVFVCYVYNPSYIDEEIYVTDSNPIYEFTLNEKTVGHGTYVPSGSIITYLDDGKVTVKYPFAWWKRPFTYGTIKRYVPSYPSDYQIPRIIECPNGALVHYGTPTKIYDEDDNLILTVFTPASTKAEPTVTDPTSRVILEYLENNNPALPCWVEWAKVTPSTTTTHYSSFSSSWSVPKGPIQTDENPSEKYGNMVYVWNGLQTRENIQLPAGYFGGVLQPVLTWNCGHLKPGKDTCTGYPKQEHWTGAAWSVPSSNRLVTHGSIVDVNPGDVVRGSLEWDKKSKLWNIAFINAATGEISTTRSNNVIPNDASLIEPYFALEKYPAELHLICSDGLNKEFWSRGNFKFTNIVLKNQNRNDITSQSTAKGDYNERMFTELIGKRCEPHSPQFQPGQYWVDSTNWPTSVTLEIPA